MKRIYLWIFGLFLAGCSGLTPAQPTLVEQTASSSALPTYSAPLAAQVTSTSSPQPTATHIPLPTPSPSLTPRPLVPPFKHIVIMMFENKEFDTVIGNPEMPNYNRLAEENTLLTQFYAIRHPSLPNYIALIGGDTFSIDSDVPNKTIDAPSLPDLIEASGRTWKAYMESMPAPCGLEDTLSYVQKHNPFVFFNPIRNNSERCQAHVVPLKQLESDLASGNLPDFIFIMPNLCNSAHDSYSRPDQCGMPVMDGWMNAWVNRLLQNAEIGRDGWIILTWDEGQGEHTCCGLDTGGGRVPTILISSQGKPGFKDDTPYTLYSLLKTISTAWGLPLLGHAADDQNAIITAPWK